MRDWRAQGPDGKAPRPILGSGIPELLSQLVRDITGLVRGELRLARAEMVAAVRTSVRSLELMAIGGVLLLVGLMLASQALVLALAPVLGAMWAVTIVAFGFALVGLLLLLRGRRALTTAHFIPERSIAQTGRDIELVKEQL